jgi:hypothetical protein
MNADELRALQATRYRQDPVAASSPFVRAATSPPPTWPAAWTGAARSCGTGMLACAGNMLLDALVACAGVTLKAAATAMNVPLRGGRVSVEGDLDFRGTLAVPRRRRWGSAPSSWTATRTSRVQGDARRHHRDALRTRLRRARRARHRLDRDRAHSRYQPARGRDHSRHDRDVGSGPARHRGRDADVEPIPRARRRAARAARR